MAKLSKHIPLRPLGYPTLEHVQRGCQYIAQGQPQPEYQTVAVQIHNPSNRKMAAILQVLTINTLAGQWMLRDIEQHKPEQRFAPFRKTNSTHFDTLSIANFISQEYRNRIRSRFSLNTYLFDGLCLSLASVISGFLQKIAESRQKGWLKRYQECASYIIKSGKHHGRTFSVLGRKTVWGYAFLSPTRRQCEDVLKHLQVLLDDKSDGQERLAAELYRMTFGPRCNRALGSLRVETLRRIKALVERDLAHSDQLEERRKVAQDYLKFTPPGFPRIQSDGLSLGRKRKLAQQHEESEQAFAALPLLDDSEELESRLINNERIMDAQNSTGLQESFVSLKIEANIATNHTLAEAERELFRELQHHAYAATKQSKYTPLRWRRADGCVKHRECALVYDEKRRRYLFLGCLLAAESRHKRTLMVKDVLVDVNNPSVPLKSGRRPSTAMLLELELGTHQQQILDQARQDTQHWKSEGKNSGSLRSATLHAHYSKGQKAPWFEVQLVIGIKPTQYLPPVNVVGVHIDPRAGWFVAVLGLDGTSVAQIHLDEQTIADWLQNDDPNQQAQILPRKRTPKEYHHRVANALIAICQYYQAQLGVENISYRHTAPEADPGIMNEEASRSIFALLNYKLARINLSKALDMRGVAPTRDCSHCGERSMTSHLERSRFHCSTCLHIEDRHINAAREVARRILWAFAQRKPRIYKGSKQKNETIA